MELEVKKRTDLIFKLMSNLDISLKDLVAASIGIYSEKSLSGVQVNNLKETTWELVKFVGSVINLTPEQEEEFQKAMHISKLMIKLTGPQEE